MKHTKNITVKTGSYTDKNGNEKGRYEKVGRVMLMDDGRELFLLNRTFNPAGVPSDRESIILNIFDVKEDDAKPAETKSAGALLSDSIPF